MRFAWDLFNRVRNSIYKSVTQESQHLSRGMGLSRRLLKMQNVTFQAKGWPHMCSAMESRGAEGENLIPWLADCSSPKETVLALCDSPLVGQM